MRLPLDTALLKPGLRLAVAVSGGADSVALLLALAERAPGLGLVLSVAHLHHGIRGPEADEDAAFVRELAGRLGLPCHQERVDVRAAAAQAGEGLEEAARRLRYDFFGRLLSAGAADAVATAHTLDDQAETVLGKLLRGAWTEGLGGIHPVVAGEHGPVLRPLLAVRRGEVEEYLRSLGQSWREDSTNRAPAYTRNRLRHHLLPALEAENPALRTALAALAELARTEDAYWRQEVERQLPGLLLEGTPVRGGGRAAGTILALDVQRLRLLPAALSRRLLRRAAALAGSTLDSAHTLALAELAHGGRAGARLDLPGNIRAERTARELRLLPAARAAAQAALPEYELPLPGEARAEAFGLRFRADLAPGIEEQPAGRTASDPAGRHPGRSLPARCATIRAWRAGDRVRLRHSSTPKRVKEILERLGVPGPHRAGWPVVALEGAILWMKGVDVEPRQGMTLTATPLAPRSPEGPPAPP